MDKVYRSGFVAIVGPTNSGKSTLLNAILGSKISIVSRKPHTTRHRVLGVKHRTDGQIAFVDTPGLSTKQPNGELSKFMARTLQDAASGVDLTLLVIDAAKFVEHPTGVRGLKAELEQRHLALPKVVAINKVDLVMKDKLLPLIQEVDRVFGSEDGPRLEIVPVSARFADGLDNLEEILLRQLPEGEVLFPPEMKSDQAEEFLVAEMVREKAFERLREELPFSIAVRIESWEDTESMQRIQAVIYVEKDSQKGILIGKQGSMLKEIGMAAREELEVLFQTKVFLGLFVRVESEWTKTARGLERVGMIGNE